MFLAVTTRNSAGTVDYLGRVWKRSCDEKKESWYGLVKRMEEEIVIKRVYKTNVNFSSGRGMHN
jgi:hypothetical protein